MLEALRGALLLGIGGTVLSSLFYLIYVATNHDSPSAFPAVLILSFIGFVTIGLGLSLILQQEKKIKTNA